MLGRQMMQVEDRGRLADRVAQDLLPGRDEVLGQTG
jgi:hypothetical protein